MSWLEAGGPLIAVPLALLAGAVASKKLGASSSRLGAIAVAALLGTGLVAVVAYWYLGSGSIRNLCSGDTVFAGWGCEIGGWERVAQLFIALAALAFAVFGLYLRSAGRLRALRWSLAATFLILACWFAFLSTSRHREDYELHSRASSQIDAIASRTPR